MDINNQSNPQEVQSVPITVEPPQKPKRFKKRQLSVKRAVKAQKYKYAAMLAGDLQTAADSLGIPYKTLYTSARNHGWLTDFKARNRNLLQRKLAEVKENLLGKPMAEAWQASQVARSIKHAEKLDKVFEQTQDPSELNQVSKAHDSVDVRARRSLGLDTKDSATVNTMVQVNLHTS